MAYAHYGRGVIIYDGIDRDQNANLAYQQYVARQLLLPFRPDPLPCTLRLAPFAITTDVVAGASRRRRRGRPSRIR